MPFECLKVLLPLGRTLLHTANDPLEFPLQRLCCGALVTLGGDVRQALPQSCHARLACLLVHEALGRALDEPGQALAERADLALSGGTLLPLPLAIGVEATGKLLGQPFGRRQEGTDFLPHRQLQALRPHLGVGTEAVATEALGLGADTAGVGIGPGPSCPGAGTQGCAGEGVAAGLTVEAALQQRACPTPRLAGMPAVCLPRLLHRGAYRGRDDGRPRAVPPVGGRHSIVRHGPPGLQGAVPLCPELRASGALPGLPKGRTAPIRGIFQ
jgi:hypothetical protein